MNILLIGNGFDLAHGLPTKYTDFLLFCKMIFGFVDEIKPNNLELKYETLYDQWIDDINKQITTDVYTNWIKKIRERLEKILKDELDKTEYMELLNHFLWVVFLEKKLSKEILYMIENNFWVEYFLQNSLYEKENWIDFENEISRVIQSLDEAMESINDIVVLSNKFLSEKHSNCIYNQQFFKPEIDSMNRITYKQIRDKLLSDLNKLTRLFEIYLCKHVQIMKIKTISPDIESIIYSKELNYNEKKKFTNETYTKVLNFNYTHVYKWVYLNTCKYGLNEIIDYVHGKADINNTIEKNNMVLGIDEYLPENRKNKDVEFIAFKKYYQRIHKGTGCKYIEWLDEIIRENYKYSKLLEEYKKYRINTNELNDEEYDAIIELKKLSKNPPKHNLYIFGHSLDVTDKDILKEFILTDNVYTTIYYRNQDQKGQQIANLVKVIGQNELIRRTGGGSARTIEFKLQQPMKNMGE